MRILGIAPSAPEQPPPGEAAPEGSEQAQPASEPPPAGERAEREPQPQPPPPPAPPSRQQQRATLRNRNADAEDPDFQRASPAHGRGGYQMGYAPQGAPQMYHPQMAGAYPGAYEGYAMPMPYGAQLGYPQPYGGPGMAYPAAASGPVVGGVHVRYAGGQQQQQQYWPAPGEAGSHGQGW